MLLIIAKKLRVLKTNSYFRKQIPIFDNKHLKNSSRYSGSPSSKYEHRQESALLRNIQNIMIFMGKKPSFP